MTIKEFKEWLNQFPDHTIVEVVYHTQGRGYYDQGGNATTVEFCPDADDFSFSKNGHFYFSGSATQPILTLGGINE
jgi:hypothetical protein